MKIISFNVNSVRTRLHQLAAVIDKHQPEIIALQETKVQDVDFPEADIEKLGYLGEEDNKLLSYFAMTSRKMKNPISVMVLSASGAGKSALQDTILSLCPKDDLVRLTSLSEKALFYKEKDALKHKVLAIAEDGGAIDADYAIRNLISRATFKI